MPDRLVTVSGGNLYSIALAFYGDALLWAQIAQENDIVDPVLTGVTTLRLPSNPISTDGIVYP